MSYFKIIIIGFSSRSLLVDNDATRRTWSYEVKPGEWAFDEPKKLISDL